MAGTQVTSSRLRPPPPAQRAQHSRRGPETRVGGPPEPRTPRGRSWRPARPVCGDPTAPGLRAPHTRAPRAGGDRDPPAPDLAELGVRHLDLQREPRRPHGHLQAAVQVLVGEVDRRVHPAARLLPADKHVVAAAGHLCAGRGRGTSVSAASRRDSGGGDAGGEATPGRLGPPHGARRERATRRRASRPGRPSRSFVHRGPAQARHQGPRAQDTARPPGMCPGQDGQAELCSCGSQMGGASPDTPHPPSLRETNRGTPESGGAGEPCSSLVNYDQSYTSSDLSTAALQCRRPEGAALKAPGPSPSPFPAAVLPRGAPANVSGSGEHRHINLLM